MKGKVSLVKVVHQLTYKANRKGEKQIVEAHDYFARVFFHELDHLDGIVFTDKVLRDKKGRILTYDDIYEVEKAQKKSKLSRRKKY